MAVDTYLRFAEAVSRLDLTETEVSGLPELRRSGAKEETKRAVEGVRSKAEQAAEAGKEARTMGGRVREQARDGG
jgi:hypothetical protein